MHPDDLPEDFFNHHNKYCPMANNYKSTLCLCRELRLADLAAFAEDKWDARREEA